MTHCSNKMFTMTLQNAHHILYSLERFASMATSKLPLSVPFPQVIFSDAQYTIIPDVSSYKLHEKNTYVYSHYSQINSERGSQTNNKIYQIPLKSI